MRPLSLIGQKQSDMGFLLMIVAKVFGELLFPLMFLWAIVRYLIIGIYTDGIKRSWTNFDTYCRRIAIGRDQLGNAEGKAFFNDTMIRRNKDNSDVRPYRFGNNDETISSAFGKNQLRGTLTKFGHWWSYRFLDKIEKDHSINSIDNTENDV